MYFSKEFPVQDIPNEMCLLLCLHMTFLALVFLHDAFAFYRTGLDSQVALIRWTSLDGSSEMHLRYMFKAVTAPATTIPRTTKDLLVPNLELLETPGVSSVPAGQQVT